MKYRLERTKTVRR